MKNLIISVLIIVLLAVGIFYFTNKTHINITPTPSPGSTTVDTTGWKTSTDSKQGITFKYPGVLGTKYISTQDWPPVAAVTNEKVTCTSAGEEEAQAGETKTITVNGHEYCVTKVSQGAAGSTYTQYAYGASINGRYAFFTFTLRFPQCANYDDPKKTECENERTSFNVDNLMDQIIQTATVAAPKITYKNATADNIVVDLPFPEAVVGKTFTVTGKARGSWYFEATFPIKVLDKNGKELVQTHADAQSSWTTPDFVPFKADVTVPASYIGPATLVLMKDNESGLPEHDASVSFPITIEY
jgi:hypothetical protein